MGVHGIVVWLIIGAIAGWLSGSLLKGGGFGLIGDIIVGIFGALIGGWLAGVLWHQYREWPHCFYHHSDYRRRYPDLSVADDQASIGRLSMEWPRL